MHFFLDLPKNDLLALDAFYLCTAIILCGWTAQLVDK